MRRRKFVMSIKCSLLAFFIFFLAFPIQKANALSCVKPEGDQVEAMLGHNQNPLWFGKATLISTDLDEQDKANTSFTAQFEIKDTYLLAHDMDALDGEVAVNISNFHRVWGVWGDMSERTSKVKIGKTGEYVFSRNEDGSLEFAAPGGCTYFSDAEWEKLRAGAYGDAQGGESVDNALLNCEEAITQVEMNMCSAQDLETSEKALKSVYDQALDSFDDEEELQEFEAVQKSWVDYRDEHCDIAADQYAGGTIMPLIYSSCMKKLADERSDHIRNMFPEWDE